MPKHEHSVGTDCELSQLENVFGHVPLLELGFNPTFFSNEDLANLSLTSTKLLSDVSEEL